MTAIPCSNSTTRKVICDCLQQIAKVSGKCRCCHGVIERPSVIEHLGKLYRRDYSDTHFAIVENRKMDGPAMYRMRMDNIPKAVRELLQTT